jgi:hypothetical protein
VLQLLHELDLIDVEDVAALIIRLLRIIMAIVMMDGDGDAPRTITTINLQHLQDDKSKYERTDKLLY